MSLPNSNAHTANAAEKPNNNAHSTQRRGQGMALRTDTRGALTVSLLRNRRKRIPTFQSASKRNQAPESKNRPKLTLEGGFWSMDSGLSAC